MNTLIKLKWCGRIMLLFVFASLLSITAFAQDEAELKSPLELKLTAQTTAFCTGSPLLLELEVTNTGQKVIETPKSHLWKQFSYSLIAPGSLHIPDGMDRFVEKAGGMDKVVDESGARLVLQPGETYRASYEFPLPSSFFQTAGQYSLMTYLDHVYSNNVTFELYDCGKPQEVKEQK